MKIERAFTMVEILIVTAIIASVVTVPIISFGALNKNARDTRRIQDIEKVSAALQQYRNETGKYPNVLTYPNLASELIPKYLTGLPRDPQNAKTLNYKYQVLNDGNSYILSVELEKSAGGNNEVFTTTPAGSSAITGTPPVPSLFQSPTGPGQANLQRTGTPTRTPTPTIPAANESFSDKIIGTGDDIAYDMAVGSDKGIVVAGVTDLINNRKGYLVKYSSLGTKQWEKAFTETNSSVNSIARVTGGFAIIGKLSGNSFLSKINNNGDVLWSRRITTTSTGFSAEAVIESSTEIFVAGTYTSGITYGFAILKYDKDGALLRKYYLTAPSVTNSFVTDVQPAADGVVVIGSFDSTTTNNSESFFVNLDQDLASIVSQKMYGGAGDQILNSLAKTTSGYVAAGLYNPTESDANGWVISLETDGDIAGTNTAVFAGATSRADYFTSIVSIGNGYLVTGETNSFNMRGTENYGLEGLVLRLNSVNSINWLRTYGGIGGDRVSAGAYQAGSTPYYIIAGEKNDSDAQLDEIFVAKVTSAGAINNCTDLYTPPTGMTISQGGTSSAISFTKSSYSDATSNIYTLTFGTPSTSSVNLCK